MNNSTTAKHLVSVKEASIITGKAERTVYTWIEKGKLQSVTISGTTFVDGLEALKYESSVKRGRPRHAVNE